MYTRVLANRRCVALAAALLFVFQALIASSALAASGLASGKAGALTIICTASGPRVVALDIQHPAQDAEQHSGALPHCCVTGCAMLGGATLPELFVLAWLLPAVTPVVPRPSVEVHFSSALARLPQKSRAPPFTA
ncbi:hypothetical protein B9P52_02240 [Achromobacter denitrificans]|uniref:DUF2946 family protein n=2 Tax=Achromobacter denitrificans TaxID=32002 RepID=UPI000B4CFB91|nr:DUF2946 family protein [Achromobacter denitrificans]ASC63174.1 hypothetical protein B9P52_02240 [Achromobacter denitrificans]MBV2159772.1 DUF2946 family protein [Achromobacter denitrificans]MDF3861830.1 DUF2946 family protein [Achromobacter denitrificans]